MKTRWLTAAAGLLLLLAPGCEKDDPIEAAGDYNGAWVGTTSSGGEAFFLVGDDKVNDLRYQTLFPDCELTSSWPGPYAIDANLFEVVEVTAKEGRNEVHGTFTSEGTCVIRYLARNWPRDNPKCPRDWDGTITATKVR